MLMVVGDPMVGFHSFQEGADEEGGHFPFGKPTGPV